MSVSDVKSAKSLKMVRIPCAPPNIKGPNVCALVEVPEHVAAVYKWMYPADVEKLKTNDWVLPVANTDAAASAKVEFRNISNVDECIALVKVKHGPNVEFYEVDFSMTTKELSTGGESNSTKAADTAAASAAPAPTVPKSPIDKADN
jgi:hypothetical protein